MGDANLYPHNLHPVTQGQPSHHNHHLDRQIQTAQMQSPYMQNPTPPHSAPTLPNGPPTNAAPSNQVPGHPSFRRQRASRACETCHARKVRCDAASLGVPCTNCVAFSIECRIPAPKRKKTQSKNKDSDSERGENTNDAQATPNTTAPASPPHETPGEKLAALHNDAKILGFEPAEDFHEKQQSYDGTYAQVMKPKFVRAPIKEAGRVAYLGESSNLSLLVHDRHGTTDVVHYPLPETIRGTRARMDDLDQVEIDILHQKGAFLLPPRGLCDELIENFFMWIAPVVPVINRTRFMRRYRDTKNPPSLLLLQAMLLAGSRVCTNPQLMDATGSTTPAAMTFYKRAKALFDANYEDDRVTIVQALILMGWYWEGPEDVTKNVFYWTRVAIIVAQGSGMHRSVEASALNRADKRLWKRIWWTLYTRDRSVAVALGRPCCINTEDSDVEMVSEEDFNDDEVDRPSEFPTDPIHVHFFLNYVKLCEIMGLVLSQQYSVACKVRKHNALDLTHSDMALADWLQNCPKEVYWEQPKHHFWSALLHANYYTTLCLLHRAHMPPAGTAATTTYNGFVVETTYPSRNIAYQAAGMITSIIESLQTHDQLRYTPAFIVYSLFSALIMHVYQMRSSNTAIVAATETRMQTCMVALKEVSKVWLVAKMVHTLFESILGNKLLEERLQKAAGNRHKKKPPVRSQPAPMKESQLKRKFDDVDAGFSNGPPAPQVSYERSRPQTPAITPSRELPPVHPGMPTLATATHSPDMPRHDAFMGNSRNATRPTSPFNPNGFSYPGTPPDLFLVTRNSPNIPQDLWSNFQPDQLFPADTNINFPITSPPLNHTFIDPQLGGTIPMLSPQGLHPQQNQQGQQMNYQQHMHQQQQPHHMQQNGMMHNQSHSPLGQQQHQHQGNPASWAQLGAMNSRPQLGNEDTWSNSSVSQGPIVPTTLNVEDWFQFFGIHGDANQLAAFGQ